MQHGIVLKGKARHPTFEQFEQFEQFERWTSQENLVPVAWLKKTRASPAHSWAVGKTMQVDTPGAVKLTRKYGDSLVCVRYRVSPDESERITTVELEVERVSVQRKANPVVAVKIYPSETQLTAMAKAKGARFNGKTRLWRMHQNDAHALGLSKPIARPEEQK